MNPITNFRIKNNLTKKGFGELVGIHYKQAERWEAQLDCSRGLRPEQALNINKKTGIDLNSMLFPKNGKRAING
jgi:hypothetical protein